MAGSQLKQLKAALKDKGLIGQTNVSQKKLKKKEFSIFHQQQHQEY